LVILVLALLVLGPDRLPQAARTMGRWVGELRKLTGSLQAEMQDVVDEVMRPVKDTATTATESFTSTYTSTEPELAADVPLATYEAPRNFPTPPIDPSLN